MGVTTEELIAELKELLAEKCYEIALLKAALKKTVVFSPEEPPDER